MPADLMAACPRVDYHGRPAAMPALAKRPRDRAARDSRIRPGCHPKRDEYP